MGMSDPMIRFIAFDQRMVKALLLPVASSLRSWMTGPFLLILMVDEFVMGRRILSMMPLAGLFPMKRMASGKGMSMMAFLVACPKLPLLVRNATFGWVSRRLALLIRICIQ